MNGAEGGETRLRLTMVGAPRRLEDYLTFVPILRKSALGFAEKLTNDSDESDGRIFLTSLGSHNSACVYSSCF